VNLGVGEEIRIADLARLIGDAMGYRGRFVFDASKPNGQPRRALDTTRARERLGWTARTPLVEGLRRTIAWWQEHRPVP
jgi:GDP-L-fucose synthase